MSASAVLHRYRDFAGLPIAAWRAVLDGDKDAYAALEERPKNRYEQWLFEDLLAELPEPDRLSDVDRCLLRGLGVIEAAVARNTSTLPFVARWLSARLRSVPLEARGVDDIASAMELSPDKTLRLAGLCLNVTRRDSAARRVLALDDAEIVAACATDTLDVIAVYSLLARQAPERLAGLAGATLARQPDHVRQILLAIAAAVLPRGALAGVELGEVRTGDIACIEHLAPERVRPFAERFAQCGEALVRTRRLAAATWATLGSAVVDGGLVSAAGLGLSHDVAALLAGQLPLPRNFDVASKRLLQLLVTAGQLHHVRQWAESALRAEADGEDVLSTLRSALQDGGLPDVRQREFLMQQLVGVHGTRGVSSFGRWLLACGDEELRASADAQLGLRASSTSLFGLVPQAAPARVPVLLDVLRAQPQSSWHRVLGALEALALAGVPGIEAIALERANAPLPSGEGQRDGLDRAHARQAAFQAWKLLADRDPEKHLDNAWRAALAAISHRDWIGGEALQWLLRKQGSDARAELTALLASAPAEFAATAASFLLAAFGDRAPEAVEWHLAHAQPYLRLNGLQRLLGLGATVDDQRVAQALKRLLAVSSASTVVQTLKVAAPTCWAWVEPRAWTLLAAASSRVRIAAAQQLAARRDDETWTRAAALLGHKQAPARLGAITLLGLLDAAEAAQLFEARLDVEANEDVRDQLLLGVKDSWQRSGRAATWADVAKRVAKAKSGRALAPWLDLASLPALHRLDDQLVPREAVAWMLARQARVKGVRPDLDADTLYELVDRTRSGDFALRLLEGFLDAGAQAEEGFVLTLVGMLGDERAVAPLTDAVHAWVKERRGIFAEYGVQALALLGNDAALKAVDDLALRYAEKPKNVGEAAAEAFDDAAERHGVTADELRDRIVPWLGFPEDGSPRIEDVGNGKRLVVGIDDDFNVTLRDAATGKAMKSVPKTAPDDLKALKKLVKQAASLQSARLRNLMVVGTRWSLARFRELFLTHPLLVPFARRLVWTAEPAGQIAFRADSVGALVDSDDRPVELASDARVGIAHPLALTEAARAAWTAAIPTQPFAQLARIATQPTTDERDTTSWHGVAGAEMPTHRMKGLTARLGWRRGDTTGGYIGTFWKAFPFADIIAHLSVDEMPVVLDMSASCTVRELCFLRRGAGRVRLGEVHPIAFSEAVADSYALAGKPPPA